MRRTRSRSKGRGNSGKAKKSPSSSPDVFSEDSQGWHKHADPDFMCYGCESGVDAMDAHCRACNVQRGFIKKVVEGSLTEARKEAKKAAEKADAAAKAEDDGPEEAAAEDHGDEEAVRS